MLEKLAKQTAVYGISTIVVRFLSYLLTPYYTRVFGQEVYGIVVDVYALIPLALTLLTMGMEDGAQYLIREYALPLDRNGYLDVMREVIAQLYEKVELKPGVRDTLARLRAEGARMCVCSNTWSSQCRTVLTRLGIDEYFDFYIEARGAMSKSSPAPFMEALHRLGGTSPAGCAVCEDALYAAQTAHDAGFYLVGIQDPTSAADAPALRRICDQFLPDWTALDWAQA